MSLRRQCELLGINRSTLYYETKVGEIDEIHLLNEIRDTWERRPFYGYRRITQELKARGCEQRSCAFVSIGTADVIGK